MPKYGVYGLVTGSKFLGVVEADTPEEAEEKGFDLEGCYCSVCNQCSDQIDDPQISEVQVEEID
jgi:hypothetical protein